MAKRDRRAFIAAALGAAALLAASRGRAQIFPSGSGSGGVVFVGQSTTTFTAIGVTTTNAVNIPFDPYVQTRTPSGGVTAPAVPAQTGTPNGVMNGGSVNSIQVTPPPGSARGGRR